MCSLNCTYTFFYFFRKKLKMKKFSELTQEEINALSEEENPIYSENSGKSWCESFLDFFRKKLKKQ